MSQIYDPGENMEEYEVEYDLKSHEQGSTTTGKKRRVMKKAPDAPKRFKSAYICFIGERMEMEKNNASNTDSKVTETMKFLANKWKELPFDEKERYELMAAADKQRFAYSFYLSIKYSNLV